MTASNTATCCTVAVIFFALAAPADVQDIQRNFSSSIENGTCAAGRFECRSGECIARELLCNGFTDCQSQDDETSNECFNVNRTCNETNSFQCLYGACISRNLVCDGISDCVDDTDETSWACRGDQKPAYIIESRQQPPIPYKTSCRAPPQPTGGKWIVPECDSRSENCNPPEGTDLTLTTLLYSCNDIGVDLHGSAQVYCLPTGNWSDTPRCVACGVTAGGNTSSATAGNVVFFPWYASLHKAESENGSRKLLCGATIVRSNLLLTAAHCVYNEPLGKQEPPDKFYVLAGPSYQEYDSPLNDPMLTRKSKVKEIYIPCTYKGLLTNYDSDIAILALEEPFEFTSTLMPICLGENNIAEEMTLQSGNLGNVAGFGNPEDGRTSAPMQITRLPYVSTDQCLRFTDGPQFVTADKFCSGCSNETLGKVDGGSGMVFQTQGIWYLYGIVSSSLGVNSASGRQTCDRSSFYLSTRIAIHMRWIQDVFSSLATNNYYRSCSEGQPGFPSSNKNLGGGSFGGGYGGYAQGGISVAGGSGGYPSSGESARPQTRPPTLPPQSSTPPTVNIKDVDEPEDCLDVPDETSMQNESNECSLEVLLCNGDSCTRKRFACNDLFTGNFGFVKKKKPCHSKLLGNVRHKIDEEKPKILCTVPPKQPNSTWHPLGCSYFEYCEVKEGEQMEPGSVLHIWCDVGYSPIEPTKTFCSTDGEWLNIPECTEIRCPQLTSVSIDADCTLDDKIVTCDSTAAISTRAILSCRNGYQRDMVSITTQREDVVCNNEGRWEPEPIRCLPVCGIPAARAVPLIVAGELANIADFPWHATLYQADMEGEKKFICGATIVRPDLLITAAHCVYDESVRKVQPADRFWVATGNIFQDWDDALHDPKIVRKAQVKNVYVNCKYLGLPGNYDLDIALLELMRPFEYSALLRPICLDHSTYGDRLSLEVGNNGRVAGFGRTAFGATSYVLQTITLPYVSYSECKRSSMDSEIEKFITYGKFCAGYRNGSAVCDGDSGGGLVFKMGDLWYLRGIVSTSLGLDTLGGDKSCDKFTYSLYTRLSNHMSWIQDIMLHLETKVPYPACSNE